MGKPQSCGKNWAEDMILALVEHVLRTNPGWFIAKTLWTDSLYILTYIQGFFVLFRAPIDPPTLQLIPPNVDYSRVDHHGSTSSHLRKLPPNQRSLD